MAPPQIAEPSQSPKPRERRLTAGVNLGTTDSLVAAVRNGAAEPLPDAQGHLILPSAVRYHAEQAGVGESACTAAVKDPFSAIISAKRLMRHGLEDIEQPGEQLPYHFHQDEPHMPFIEAAQGLKSPVEVSADILRGLRQRVKTTLSDELVGAAITVPTYFDGTQRQATRGVARLAGLNVLRLLNESVTVAVAYGLDKGAKGLVATYDLGGGAFDISILRLTRGILEVLAISGGTALDDDGFDHATAGRVIEQADLSTGLDPGSRWWLLQIARTAKERLTSKVPVRTAYSDWNSELSRATLDKLIGPSVARSLKSRRQTTRDSGVDPKEIHPVVMVGGSTHVPHVRTAVGELFGYESLTDIGPDQVIATSVTIQADVLVDNRHDEELPLLDVIPLSLGLKTMDELMEKVIPRNTTVPATHTQEFTTYKDGQATMMVRVLQGERELMKGCRSPACFELRDIPPTVTGATRIRVTFQAGADGLLGVPARKLGSGIGASIQIKLSYGLTDDKTAQILKDSFDYAGGSKAAHAPYEQQVEAQRLLKAVQSALDVGGKRLLDEGGRLAITTQMNTLRELAGSSNIATIENQIKYLSQVTDAFTVRRVDVTVKAAFSGHRLNGVEEQTRMPQIVILLHVDHYPEGTVFETRSDGTTLNAALHNGIKIEHACEESYARTAYHVIVRENFDSMESSDELEDDMLGRTWGLGPGSRLSCQVVVADEDLVAETSKYTINQVPESHWARQ